ncbi:hypothetical protein OR16_31609 [Cupriavidus basilensis OR16]|uniref:Uncharacterized protein n=1 Tax=Cupriavidus basilensis OR16 TaxID=1127483 RepID=H1SDL6_9BURK|nr:hypothetical protein [Cupriavidus basilensis]EHP39401.1 hypothetical protein OR16_31609 [Cupriavidus basilensis OR16]
MKTAQQIADTQAMFEILAGEKYSWTPELSELAEGYFTFQQCAMGADNPLSVAEAIAMSVGLIGFANAVGWISEAGYRALMIKASEVRQEISSRWAGQFVVVPFGRSAATPATSH